MSHRFDDRAGETKIDPAELRALLERLEPIDEVDRTMAEFDDTVTVSAVCEATGVEAHVVIDILAEVRERVAEARLVQTIRELEEPLFRVERPGHAAPDATRNLPPLHRAQLFTDLMEDVVRTRKPKVKLSAPHAKSARWIEAFILIVFAIVLIGAVVVGIRTTFGR